jgi:hypothetical protein
VALLGLGVPAFERAQEEGVRVAAHDGGVGSGVQGAEPKHEAVVYHVQTALGVLDRLPTGTIELSPERPASGVSHRKQLPQARCLRRPTPRVHELTAAADPDFDLEEGVATLTVKDLDQEDYHNLLNALTDGPSDPASASFNMRWAATEPSMNVTDAVHGFTGRFRISTVSIEWSASVGSFEFTSDPATTVNVRSVIGRERNGVFFQ